MLENPRATEINKTWNDRRTITNVQTYLAFVTFKNILSFGKNHKEYVENVKLIVGQVKRYDECSLIHLSKVAAEAP